MVCALYLNKDATFFNAAVDFRAHQHGNISQLHSPAVADLGGAFSWLPHMKLYYKYIFGVDHNSYLKCIKCRSEQSDGLNYCPK